MSEPVKLRECPFCGSEPVINEKPCGLNGMVRCPNGCVLYMTKEYWNKRFELPRQEENGLMPLDYQEVLGVLLLAKPQEINTNYEVDMDKVARLICDKFACPAAMSESDIIKIIHDNIDFYENENCNAGVEKCAHAIHQKMISGR